MIDTVNLFRVQLDRFKGTAPGDFLPLVFFAQLLFLVLIAMSRNDTLDALPGSMTPAMQR
jgi:hypothetical protein